MSLEFQKFYRFILPGALLVASDSIAIWQFIESHINNIRDVNSFILSLSMLAIILGVPLYWIYVVLWHFRFERKRMQDKEVEWLDSKIVRTDRNIYDYSNLIWNHIDSEGKYERFSSWLRNNFLLIHSLGSSAVALMIGFIIYIAIKRCDFLGEAVSLIWIIWVFLLYCLLKYRFELKKRYMKRLEIFIKLKSELILKDLEKYSQKN